MIEWAFLVMTLATSEQQRDNRVHCNNSRCYVEVGGFRDAESCTLALLSFQADVQRKGLKILKIEGGNKCKQREAREIREAD